MQPVDLIVEQESQKEPVATGQRKSRLKYDVILILTTVIWGGSFLVIKETLTVIGPFTYLGLSHIIATLTLVAIFRKHLLRIARKELLAGLLLGIVFFAAYALQTIGMQWTTVSKAGFITGLYVPLVPLLSRYLLKQRISGLVGIAVLLSVAGLFLLSANQQFSLTFGKGEWLLLGCAGIYALQITLIGRFAPRMDPVNLVFIQLALTTLLSILCVPLNSEPLVVPPKEVWGPVLFMGVIDIACTQLTINWVQQFISTTRAALLYALEPMWAAFFGVLLAGDILSLPAVVGCAFIFGGMVIGRLDRLPLRRKHL